MGYQGNGKVTRRAGDISPVDPALLARSDVRAFLAGHDIGAFYRVLCDNGWSQHRITKATTTQQCAVSEIIKGRRVIDYRVLVRIADGLGIPAGADAPRLRGRRRLRWWSHGHRPPRGGECGDAPSRVAGRCRDGRCGPAVARPWGAGRWGVRASAGPAAVPDL
jgi:hypothetical protein